MTYSLRGNPVLSGIGPAARISGLTPRAIRLYEARGLVSPQRTGRGARAYDAETVQRLCFIAMVREVGLSLAEIKDLLSVGDRHGEDERKARLRSLVVSRHDQTLNQLARIRTLAPRLGIAVSSLDERSHRAGSDMPDRPALVAGTGA
jgi:DNA-binding transcriptional MerR regulator